MVKTISARYVVSVSLSKDDAELLDALRSKNISIVEVFRRGLNIMGYENGLSPVADTEK